MKRIVTLLMVLAMLFQTTACAAKAAPAFADVSPGADYAQAVAWCAEKGLMNGVGDGTNFDPGGSMTRAMLATVLYRQAGEPKVNGAPGFTDVLPNVWYSNAVAWAAEKQFLQGYGNGLFGVDDPVSREMLQVVIARQNGETPAWTGSAELAVPAARAEAAVALYETFHERKPTPTFQSSGTSPAEERSKDLELTKKEEEPLSYDGVYLQHKPYGTAVGAMPGRVVWAHDPASVSWDGSGYWWELDHFDEGAIQALVDRSIASLGGKDTAKDGWAALFAANRRSRGLTGGYTKGQKIAIKANINGSGVIDDDTSGRTAMSYTNPVLLKVLLTSLVRDAGADPSDITVYDVSRLFPEYMVELCTQGELDGVHFVGRNNGVADENAPIQWSHSFSGKVNYLPTCVTGAEYVINLANLKGHSYGITLCGKNHFGSFINGNLMRPPEGANLHQWLTRNEMGIYSPLVDLMANANLGGKTVLYMLDAIICAPSEGASITADNAKWQQVPFNGYYTASVFVSQDPVAIDSVGADFLMNEPAVTSRNGSLRNNATVENYLHEAALVSQAPSGTAYTDSQGHTVSNLGVHEHWNNSVQKQYSRNLGKTEGIELIQLREE